MSKLLKGTYTALVTPFDENLNIDFKAFEKLLDYQIENGVTGVVVCGSTGESATLSAKEKIALITHTVEYVNNRVQVIAGTGSNNTEETKNLTLVAKEHGVDAVLLVAPYYNKPTQEGLYYHYKLVADEVDIPQIIYNVPGRSGVNILPEVQLKLANDCPNIIATKEASGNLEQIMSIIQDAPANFSVLSGDDSLTVPIVLMGGDGVIGVTPNYAPKDFSNMVNYALEMNTIEAVNLHYKLYEMMNLNFIDSNPVPVKTAMNLMGMMSANFRMPLIKMNDEKIKLLNNGLAKIGLK